MEKTGRKRMRERKSREWERLGERVREEERVENGKDWEKENERKRE